jgi:DNA processing protein
VLTPSDIIEDMDWESAVRNTEITEDVVQENLDSLTPNERLVLEAVSSGVTTDWAELQRATGMSIGELSMVVVELEMKGLVRALPGRRYERV